MTAVLQAAPRVETAARAAPVVTPKVGAATGLLQRKCACGGAPGADGECAECREKRLQLRRAGSGPAPSGVPPIVHEVLRSPGQPLDAATRSFMEPRLGHHFRDVRVHADRRAAASAAVVNALAYTVGRDVVFGAGQYAPATAAGRRLLAHELAHVVQQDGSSLDVATLSLDAPGESAAEREAEAAGAAVETGAPVVVRSTGAGLVQRQVGAPAGGCGVCYGTPADAGTQAHIEIEAAFAAQRNVLTEFPLLILPSPGDENGRLDLARPIADGYEIGEIKPANPAGWLQGDLDLMWYEDEISKYGGRVRRMTELTVPPPLGGIPMPNPQVPDCPEQLIYVDFPVRGIYTYWCQPGFAQLRALPQCNCRTGGRPVPVPVPVPVPERERERARRRVTVPELEPVPVPVPARREVLEEIRDFIRRVVETGEDAAEAARRFLREHPEVLEYIGAFAAGVLIGAAVGIVVATIIEDIASGGVGILDDPASFAAAAALVRAAMELLQRGGQMAPALP